MNAFPLHLPSFVLISFSVNSPWSIFTVCKCWQENHFHVFLGTDFELYIGVCLQHHHCTVILLMSDKHHKHHTGHSSAGTKAMASMSHNCQVSEKENIHSIYYLDWLLFLCFSWLLVFAGMGPDAPWCVDSEVLSWWPTDKSVCITSVSSRLPVEQSFMDTRTDFCLPVLVPVLHLCWALVLQSVPCHRKKKNTTVSGCCMDCSFYLELALISCPSCA